MGITREAGIVGELADGAIAVALRETPPALLVPPVQQVGDQAH